MVSPLLLSKGLRKEENNEKKRKRVKRNEIQCMILLKSSIFVPTKPEFCLNKDIVNTQISWKVVFVDMCRVRFNNYISSMFLCFINHVFGYSISSYIDFKYDQNLGE